MKQLTVKQADILLWIWKYVLIHARQPAFREVLAGTSMKSTSSITYNLREIEKKGWVQLSFNRKNGLIRFVLNPETGQPFKGLRPAE